MAARISAPRICVRLRVVFTECHFTECDSQNANCRIVGQEAENGKRKIEIGNRIPDEELQKAKEPARCRRYERLGGQSAGVHGVWGDVVEVDETQLDKVAFELRRQRLEGA